jgi:lipoate-protein ligase A
MPYYKLFTGEMKADDITIENCKYHHLDYSKIIKSFNETQKKISEKAFKELALPVTSINNEFLQNVYINILMK